jgi:hypothetical protein
MRQAAFLILIACFSAAVLPSTKDVQARSGHAARAPSIAAITIPGVSPLATVINHAGTRALLVVREKAGKGVDVILVDTRSGRLLHRATLPHSSDYQDHAASAGLDERRGRAYIVIDVDRKVASTVFVVDFGSGLVTATFHDNVLNLGAGPVVDETTGNVWLVDVDEHRSYLVRFDPRAKDGAVKRFDLAVVGANGGSDIATGVLKVDARDRRLVVTWSYEPQKYAGFDLDSGRLIWTFTSPVSVNGILQPVLDTSTGVFWIGDPTRAVVFSVMTTTGARRRVSVGAKNQRVVHVSLAPAGGLLIVRSGAGVMQLVSITGASAHSHVIATLQTLRAVKLLDQMTGPHSSRYYAAVYDEQAASGTARDYYLSYTFEGQIPTPHLSSDSQLSVLDWKTGTIRSQQPLPVEGDLIQGREGWFDGGFYVTIGLGKRNLDTLAWEGAALLVVRTP